MINNTKDLYVNHEEINNNKMTLYVRNVHLQLLKTIIETKEQKIKDSIHVTTAGLG